MVPLCLFAIAVGVWFVLSALLNWEWYKALYDVAATETLFGETAARWSFGLGGAAIIGYAVYYLIHPH
jgi:hypothetical protein